LLRAHIHTTFENRSSYFISGAISFLGRIDTSLGDGQRASNWKTALAIKNALRTFRRAEDGVSETKRFSPRRAASMLRG
jgi:hypothetical protein